jgi:hypothetical protein
VKGEYKKFNAELHAKNDRLAKRICINFLPRILKRINFEKYEFVKVIQNEDKYGPDLKCLLGGKLIAYFEPEIKYNWSGEKGFPFADLHIPERKEKFTKLGAPISFVVLSRCLTRLAFVKRGDLLKSKKHEVPNKYVKKGELFFKVPKGKVKFVSLVDFADTKIF